MRKNLLAALLSLVLSIMSLCISCVNFNGALSEPYRNVAPVEFYGILSAPVALALAALVLGIIVYTAVMVHLASTKGVDEETPEK